MIAHLPCEDVLTVVIPQVHLRRTADGNTLGLSVQVFHHVRD
jgi:hypothetical protein